MPIVIPLLLIGAGAAALLVTALTTGDRPVPDHEPDVPLAPPPPPSSSRYRRVDAIMGELQKAAASSGIPLGVLVGWIAKESGGKLEETTRYNERGLFQLMPDESKALGLDHNRLSSDLVYSINAGLLLIGKYMKDVTAMGIATAGSSYFWRLVKLCHSMGTGAVKKIIAAAKNDGSVASWNDLESYAENNDSRFLSETKHSPKKWFPFVDAVYDAGVKFGFGSDATAIVGAGAKFDDIPDPLDCLKS